MYSVTTLTDSGKLSELPERSWPLLELLRNIADDLTSYGTIPMTTAEIRQLLGIDLGSGSNLQRGAEQPFRPADARQKRGCRGDDETGRAGGGAMQGARARG